ncbi:hypothetical protein ES332_D04G041200v1 [Gossypium tomentosum]|uniref:Uncharacterized protein n=1 Tax=Gossypium tomentosum TaxID=34277 RepID=A0A5D2LC57_GOSTO|nr:hypothetical protein ES332_D04G041200v1 [Gossypium tomentosum]
MQLQAILKYHLILGLVDSGSTYNFTSVIVAKCLGLPIQAQSGLSSNGQWRKGHQFKNFPRGIKWLQTLGPVVWDFVAFTMKFSLGEK